MSLIDSNPTLANDPNNSSTTNLLAGQTFTGKPSTAPYGGVITVFLCTDQICYVYFEQSANGINWDHQLIFSPDADRATEGFGGKGDTESWSIRSLALYYRIRVLNPTAITTTYFRLATQLTTQGNGGLACLVDDDGHAIESSQASNGEYHLNVNTTQAVVLSSKNSYSGTLAASGTYTGTMDVTLGVAAIQVMLKADQNCTVYVDQSGNSGTNWDISDSYLYYHIKGGQSWTTQAVGDSFRVRLLNTATTPTTYTRLTTALCPIVEAVPRALTQNGNFKVDVNEMLGTFGAPVASTPMGAMRTSDSVRLVGATFSDGAILDTNFWGSTAVGSGTIVPGNNQASIETGVLVNSAGTIQSIRSGRYVASQACYYRAILRVPSTTGANRRRWGAYNALTGYFYEYDGTTLSLVCRKSGAETNRVASGNFNGDVGNAYLIDSNAQTFEIYWTNKSAWFVIDDALVHKFSGVTSPLTSTNSLPAAAECANIAGNTSNNALELRTSSICRFGQLSTESTYKFISSPTTTICKYSPGRLHRIVLNDPDGAAQNITIYDSTGGATNTIAALKVPNIDNAVASVTVEFDCPFHTGLTIVTSASNGVTVIYE